MKTILIRIDLESGSALTQDCGDKSWEETTALMNGLREEMAFFGKRPTKPRTIRVGRARIVLVGFYDGRTGIEPSRDEPEEER